MKTRRWNSDENEFLVEHAHRVPWEDIARTLGRTEAACKAKFEKIKKFRKSMGRWKGI